jgi:hypothetical protein
LTRLLPRGKEIYSPNCAFCHRADSGGGETGPDLGKSLAIADDTAGKEPCGDALDVRVFGEQVIERPIEAEDFAGWGDWVSILVCPAMPGRVRVLEQDQSVSESDRPRSVLWARRTCRKASYRANA